MEELEDFEVLMKFHFGNPKVTLTCSFSVDRMILIDFSSSDLVTLSDSYWCLTSDRPQGQGPPQQLPGSSPSTDQA